MIKKWLCKIFGHKYMITDPVRGIAGDLRCKRCGDISEGVKWPHPPEKGI